MCRKREEAKANIKLGKHKLEEVKEFSYLGSRITNDGRSKKEIASRIAQAKRAFYKNKNLLTAENTSIEVRKQFIRCYIWSIFLLWKRGLDVDSSREVKSGSIRNVLLPKNDEDKMDRPHK